jgi:hypothetical protein
MDAGRGAVVGGREGDGVARSPETMSEVQPAARRQSRSTRKMFRIPGACICRSLDSIGISDLRSFYSGGFMGGGLAGRLF